MVNKNTKCFALLAITGVFFLIIAEGYDFLLQIATQNPKNLIIYSGIIMVWVGMLGMFYHEL